MRLRIANLVKSLSLAQRFLLASLVILVAGMLGLGAWIGQQIAAGVVQNTAATTALYVDSFIAPEVQELSQRDTLTPEHVANLRGLLQNTSLGQQIAALKIWNAQGRILYSTDSAEIDTVFPVQGGLARSWGGEVAAEISDLQNAENALERAHDTQLLEIYSPVRLRGTDQIIAVAEFYQHVDDLQREIVAAERRSWLVVGAVTLVMYLLLAGFIQRASDTITRQELALRDQVAQLTDLLTQNAELHERVRRAATRTTALNERVLRRISAELHDGPAQELGLALLRLDHVSQPCAVCPSASQRPPEDTLDVIQNSLRRALQELRAISTGLGVPQLTQLSIAETVARVVRAHERRTGTRVAITIGNLPDQAPLPVKITLYRVIQEALSNAYRHAGGVDQQVHVGCAADTLHIEVADGGPGFAGEPISNGVEHLGLIGMRERVESLGGQFQVNSLPGQGTTVIADLALHVAEDLDERANPSSNHRRSPAVS
jgi:signal transduction histidine kinase